MKQSYMFSGVIIIALIVCTALAITVYLFGGIVDYISLPFVIIDRVFTFNNSVYAHGKVDASYGIGNIYGENEKEIIYISSDAGKTWQVTEVIPHSVVDYFKEPVDSPKVLCEQQANLICYRIVGGEDWIEISMDRGSSWRKDWKTPLGRKYYMERHSGFPFTGVEPDTFPYDIALLASNNGDCFVVVAMGNQGVLIRKNEDEWNRVAVSKDFPRAAPTPYYADSVNELLANIGREGIVGLLFSFGYFVVMTIYGLANLHLRLDIQLRYKALLFYLPFIVLSVVCFYLIRLYYQNEIYFWMFIKGEWIDYKVEYVYGLPVLGLISTWGLFIAVTHRRNVGLLASLIPLLSTLTLVLGILLPLIFWAFGIIPFYGIALALSFALGILIVHNGLQLQSRINAKTTESIYH